MNTFRAACKTIFVVCIFLWTTFCTAQTITGSVHNETTGKPSAGDDVVLLRLSNGMLDEAQTKTDNQGRFTFNMQFPDQSYVVRVLHQGVNYDRSVTSNAPLDIKVYDSAAKVEGITGYITIIKIESDGKDFKVIEQHLLNNASNPPRTQANPRNFEWALPAKAKIDSVMVAGPGGIGVRTEPTLIPGQQNLYAVSFAIKPGMTRYWVTYHLPNKERIVFRPFLPYPTQMYSVQYPASMTFMTSEKSGFHPILDQNGMKVEAITSANAGPAPEFQLSGVGALPPDRQVTDALSRTVPARPSSTGTSVGTGTNHTPTAAKPAPATTPQRWAGKRWVIGGVVVLGIATLIILLWRTQVGRRQAEREALKEKLFKLENDRLRGSISAEQYATTKETLNQSLEQLVGKGKS
jgi:hypothetical protein